MYGGAGRKDSSLERRSFRLDGVLDELNLLGDRRKLVLFKSIELVEATPSATLVRTTKNAGGNESE